MGGTSTSSISARDVPPSSGDPGWTTSHPKSQAAGAVARQFHGSHSVRMPRKPDTIWLRTWAHKKVMSTIKMARKKKESWWFTRKMGLILGISGFPEIAYDMCVCDFVCACCLADTMCTFQPFVVIWCYMLIQLQVQQTLASHAVQRFAAAKVWDYAVVHTSLRQWKRLHNEVARIERGTCALICIAMW